MSFFVIRSSLLLPKPGGWGSAGCRPLQGQKSSEKCKNPDFPSENLDFSGDPYGNRTHVTAVKGRCLNRLTNGPGSGNLIRTDDIPGMNRLLYQLSYAAMWSNDLGTAETSFLIISARPAFVKKFFHIFLSRRGFLCKNPAKAVPSPEMRRYSARFLPWKNRASIPGPTCAPVNGSWGAMISSRGWAMAQIMSARACASSGQSPWEMATR